MNFKFKVPGKIMLNGAYLVLYGESCISVSLDSYLSVQVILEDGDKILDLRINDREYKYYYINNRWQHNNIHNDSQYLHSIINLAFKDPVGSIKIFADFDSGFYTPDRCKTGIGSSSCLLVALCYVSAKMNNISSFYDFCMGIHYEVNPGSSGYDTSSCINGNIIFSRKEWIKYLPKEKYIILGTFNKSTSSREMIDSISVNDTWESVKKINRRIIDGDDCYEEYLDAIRGISTVIVPDRQYELLKKTFELGVKKCGVSGAGGEDAIWALEDDYFKVVNLWNKEMSYLRVCEISPHGLIEN